MGKTKKTAAAATAKSAKDRHRRIGKGNRAWAAPMQQGLVAIPEKNIAQSKHESYYELVENTDKKKKLEFEVTLDRRPPPGYEFVPSGNPGLTTACKELSREQDAMIFIVTAAKDRDEGNLSFHLNRLGHHIRRTIVEQAREELGQEEESSDDSYDGNPEPIPETQEEIYAQANAAVMDLFPRIPNTDRHMIVQHAFEKGGLFQGQPVVGMAADIPLSRRVQLAVLAHIRHTHTRYDKLLRETNYINARKVVEPVCLDILVKWRGDEETGRDQLDEILREIVVISDDEDESSGDESDASSVTSIRIEADLRASEALATRTTRIGASAFQPLHPLTPEPTQRGGVYVRKYDPMTSQPYAPAGTSGPSKASPIPFETSPSGNTRRIPRKQQRGFKRYAAAAAQRQVAWEQAINRNRSGVDAPAAGSGTSPRRPPSSGLSRSAAGPSLQGFAHVYADYAPDIGTRQSRHSGQPISHSTVRQRLAAPAVEQHDYRSSPVIAQTSAFGEGTRLFRLSGGPHDQPAATAPRGGPVLERRRAEDLRDYLVPSIEPASPATSQTPAQFADDGYVVQGQVSARAHDGASHHMPQHQLDHFGEPILVKRQYSPGAMARNAEPILVRTVDRTQLMAHGSRHTPGVHSSGERAHTAGNTYRYRQARPANGLPQAEIIDRDGRRYLVVDQTPRQPPAPNASNPVPQRFETAAPTFQDYSPHRNPPMRQGATQANGVQQGQLSAPYQDVMMRGTSPRPEQRAPLHATPSMHAHPHANAAFSRPVNLAPGPPQAWGQSQYTSQPPDERHRFAEMRAAPESHSVPMEVRSHSHQGYHPPSQAPQPRRLVYYGESPPRGA